MPIRPRVPRVTLAAVARDARVALSTASIILSQNSAYLRNFTQSTILRVRASAEKLGYRPSLIASGLPSKGSSIFFLVALHDLHRATDGERFSWGFDANLLGGIAEAAQESRIYPIMTLTRPHTAQLDGENLDRIIRGGVFGTIIRSPSPLIETQIRQYLREGTPVVIVFPGALADWPTNVVDVDNVAIGRRAGELFASQNRKKWMIVLDQQREAHALRLRGFRAAARQAKATLRIVKCDYRLEVPQAAAVISEALIGFRADGIFGLTSRAAEGAQALCERANLRLGSDTLLLGCDCSMWHRPHLPKITSLEASWREIGHQALRMLMKMRDEGKTRHPRVLLDPIVVPGDTCPTDADEATEAGRVNAGVG